MSCLIYLLDAVVIWKWLNHLWVVEEGGGRWKNEEKTTEEAKRTVWKRSGKEMLIHSSAPVAGGYQLCFLNDRASGFACFNLQTTNYVTQLNIILCSRYLGVLFLLSQEFTGFHSFNRMKMVWNSVSDYLINPIFTLRLALILLYTLSWGKLLVLKLLNALLLFAPAFSFCHSTRGI